MKIKKFHWYVEENENKEKKNRKNSIDAKLAITSYINKQKEKIKIKYLKK